MVLFLQLKVWKERKNGRHFPIFSLSIMFSINEFCKKNTAFECRLSISFATPQNYSRYLCKRVTKILNIINV